MAAIGTGVAISLAIVVGALAVHLGSRDRRDRDVPANLRFDDSEFRRTDAGQLLYVERRGFEPGFAAVGAVAVGPIDAAGTPGIYVSGDRAISVHDAGGRPVRMVDVGEVPAPARALAVGPAGTLYVGLADHVEVYDVAGQRTATWESLGPDALLTSIGLGKSDVFVADAGDRVVLRYGRDGRLLSRIGERDPERDIEGIVVYKPYLDLYVEAASGGAERLIVANPGRHRIETYDDAGDLLRSWGEYGAAVEGFCGCCNPVNIAPLPDGALVTAEKGIARVKVYDASGGFVGLVAGPESFEHERTGLEGAGELALDVAVDARGRVLVLDLRKRAVRIFERRTDAAGERGGAG